MSVSMCMPYACVYVRMYLCVCVYASTASGDGGCILTFHGIEIGGITNVHINIHSHSHVNHTRTEMHCGCPITRHYEHKNQTDYYVHVCIHIHSDSQVNHTRRDTNGCPETRLYEHIPGDIIHMHPTFPCNIYTYTMYIYNAAFHCNIHTYIYAYIHNTYIHIRRSALSLICNTTCKTQNQDMISAYLKETPQERTGQT